MPCSLIDFPKILAKHHGILSINSIFATCNTDRLVLVVILFCFSAQIWPEFDTYNRHCSCCEQCTAKLYSVKVANFSTIQY